MLTVPLFSTLPPRVQEEAAVHLSTEDWQGEGQAALRARYARCRNLGFQCTALALKYASSDDVKAQLLAGTGHR